MSERGKFTISRNSWHYRFMDKMEMAPRWRTNLCAYLRGFISALLLAALFYGGFAVVGLGVFGYTLLNWGLVQTLFLHDVGFTIVYSVAFAFGVCGLLIDGAIVGGFVASQIRDWYQSRSSEMWSQGKTFWGGKRVEKPTKPPKPKRGPSIFRKGYDAWHTKTCPLVEFQD